MFVVHSVAIGKHVHLNGHLEECCREGAGFLAHFGIQNIVGEIADLNADLPSS